MNEAAQRVCGHHSQNPHDRENQNNCPHHSALIYEAYARQYPSHFVSIDLRTPMDDSERAGFLTPSLASYYKLL